MLLRSRASAGAVLEGIRKGRARRGMLPLQCFVLGWCFFSAAARRAWGVSVVQTRGVFGSLGGERRGGGLWGAPSGGASYGLPSSSLSAWGDDGPPLVQHRPRVTYSGTAKGPLLGGLPIVSGLEGVCEAWKEGEGAESCCLLLKRLERCEGNRNKARHGGEERGVLFWCPSLLPPPCKAWGGL